MVRYGISGLKIILGRSPVKMTAQIHFSSDILDFPQGDKITSPPLPSAMANDSGNLSGKFTYLYDFTIDTANLR